MRLKLPKNLIEAIKNDDLVLFIGAGCSISLGLPSWKDLIIDILNELDVKYGTSSNLNFKNVLANVESESITLFEALDKIEKENDYYKVEVKKIINRKIEAISIEEASSDIHTKLWQLSKKIITTNYDKLLEKHKPKDNDIKIFENQNKFQSARSQKKESHFLYKIHGDYENPETIILFESDYRAIYNDKGHNQDALESFFKGNTLLFIGFSLTDPFVNELFSNVKNMYNGYSLNDHYFFTTKNQNFSKYDINMILLSDWEQNLTYHIDELIKIKEETVNNNVVEIKVNNNNEEIDDFNSIKVLIKQKIEELKVNPSCQVLHSEISDLRRKVDELLFGEIDFLQEIKDYKNSGLRSLFSDVYSLEVYSKDIFDKINQVRIDYEKYSWYERSVILSAITCNIIHFNKADERKINLLIDFINDNEERVWKKSITYLFLVLNHLGNKWVRFSGLKNKLESLRQNPKIQEACLTIINIFNIGFHNVTLPPNIFDNDYFKDNSFNYFLPFFIDNGNEGFLSVYENYEGDVDRFIDFLNDISLPDQMKYLLCTSKIEDKAKHTTDKKKENDLVKFKNLLAFNSFFYPYSIYIQEMISFYKFFPKLKHTELLNSQLKITQTPIKEYLLNEVEKSKALALHFMQEKNWGQAIVNIKQAINLKGRDVELLHYLKICYNENKDFDNELIIREEIYSKDNKDEENICELISLYKNKNDYSKAMKFSSELINIDGESAIYFYNRALIYKLKKKYREAILDCNNGIHFDAEVLDLYDLRSVCYYELGDYENSIIDCNFLIKQKDNVAAYYYTRTMCYFWLMRYEDALLDCDRAINLSPEESDFYHTKAAIFRNLKEYTKAMDECNNFIRLEPNKIDYYCDRAFIYLCNNDFSGALQDIKNAEKIDPKYPRIYSCYANYYRLQGDYRKAIDYINKAIDNDTKNTSLFIGIKAEIYGSMDDNKNFFALLEEALKKDLDVNNIFPDILSKYTKNKKFIDLMNQYNKKVHSKIL